MTRATTPLMKSVRYWFRPLTRQILTLAICPALYAQSEPAHSVEPHRNVLMPAGIRVQATELDGPVFADKNGKTLYKWPQHKLRNGYSGEPPGTPLCTDDAVHVTAGLMSPYPPGIHLPDQSTIRSCTMLWPPALARDGAESVGDWSVVERADGRLQWAYDEQPLYTSVRDRGVGEVLGGSSFKYGGDSPAMRVPVGPPSQVPPGFAVKSTTRGRLLTTATNASIYAHEGDSQAQTQCYGRCLERWEPVRAPALARPRGDWQIFERSPGELQWVFRGKPLYTHRMDQRSWSQEGSDEAGWSNIYMTRAPQFPRSFTVQATLAGEVLATREGKSIYVYVCGEDSAVQLACDHPDDTQVYRFAMCGAGDAKKCAEHWPYVRAGPQERSLSVTWRVLHINPETGRKVPAEDSRGVRVWAYRDRPVYTYAGDLKPGDVHGAGTGEWRGLRNGLLAFWLRDDYMEGTL